MVEFEVMRNESEGSRGLTTRARQGPTSRRKTHFSTTKSTSRSLTYCNRLRRFVLETWVVLKQEDHSEEFHGKKTAASSNFTRAGCVILPLGQFSFISQL